MIAAPLWVLLSAWIVLASLLACVSMFWDKLSALRGWRRIPERRLLFWAFVGGAAGAKAGQRIFRHKTRKEPFRTHLNLAVAVNVIVVLCVIVLEIGGAEALCRQEPALLAAVCAVSPS